MNLKTLTGNSACACCKKSFAEVEVCCSAATYDDGTYDDGLCINCCEPHSSNKSRSQYERMDCDQ